MAKSNNNEVKTWEKNQKTSNNEVGKNIPLIERPYLMATAGIYNISGNWRAKLKAMIKYTTLSAYITIHIITNSTEKLQSSWDMHSPTYNIGLSPKKQQMVKSFLLF